MDNQINLFNRDRAVHPGAMVIEYLEFNEWSQRDLARRTGLTPKTISEICNGKAPITPTTALALENVFGRPAHFWLNLQRRYDEAEARLNLATKTKQWRDWAKRFPLKDMKRFRWIEMNDPAKNEIEVLLQFFGVSSPDSWRAVWETCRVVYRQTRKFQTTEEAVSAWVRETEIEAGKIDFEVKEFDETRLRESLSELRQQTKEPVSKFVPRVQSICATAGVVVVWVPQLPQTGISGCARWLSDTKALIGLSLRYKWDHQMWFTFFHEIGHLLLHGKDHDFVVDNPTEDVCDRVIDPQMQKHEEEANRFALDALIPPTALAEFIEKAEFTNDAVLTFAQKQGIGPGILIGRLQQEGILKYHQGTRLMRKFEWEY
jgi:HTH-type transcriptional regulator / antitoxin HigA